MKRKSVALIVTLSMMLSIVGCGSKADDAPNESQVVVESSTVESTAESMVEPETVVETEPTESVETPVSTEETAVVEPRLKVEIVEKIESECIVIASVTNVSDETYGFFPSGLVTAKEDPNFEPGETTYVWGSTDLNGDRIADINEDEITAEIEHSLTEKGNNYDTVTHMDTFTAEQFADAVTLVESFMVDNSDKQPYFVAYYNDDALLGTNNFIYVDETTHELNLYYEGANKIIVLWSEITE